MAYTTWLPKINRAGAVYTTPNVTVPAGLDEIRIHLVVTPSAFSTSSRSISILVEAYVDDQWQFVKETNWIGGPTPSAPGKPSGWFSGMGGISQYAGKLIHAIVTQNGTFSWGLEGEIL